MPKKSSPITSININRQKIKADGNRCTAKDLIERSGALQGDEAAYFYDMFLGKVFAEIFVFPFIPFNQNCAIVFRFDQVISIRISDAIQRAEFDAPVIERRLRPDSPQYLFKNPVFAVLRIDSAGE